MFVPSNAYPGTDARPTRVTSRTADGGAATISEGQRRSPLRRWIAWALLTAALSQAVLAVKVEVRADRAVDLGAFRTYRWQEPTRERTESRVADPKALENALRRLVEEHLLSLGYELAEEGLGADLAVLVDGAIGDEFDSILMRRELDSGVSWVGMRSADSVDEPFREAQRVSLMVTLRTAEKGQAVWSGFTSQLVKDLDNPIPQASRMMRRILKKLRPSR